MAQAILNKKILFSEPLGYGYSTLHVTVHRKVCYKWEHAYVLTLHPTVLKQFVCALCQGFLGQKSSIQYCGVT